ncbi:MAG: (Fe-S)-binding protein [bacterium]|nr:(Fe-S)-binding protein [bacterium]
MGRIKHFFDHLLGGNTAYYPGCLTHFALPEVEQNYKTILKKLGVNFVTIPETICCGSPALHAGYKEDFERLRTKNKETFSKYGVNKIITNCPACYRVLTDAGFKVEHITQVIEKHLNKLEVKHSGKISYHDPCHLGRHSNLYEPPRKILQHIGFELEELPNNREKALCCGAGGGVKTNYPNLSNKIAKQLIETSKRDLVTTCPMCYKQLKDNSSKIKVIELSELLI